MAANQADLSTTPTPGNRLTQLWESIVGFANTPDGVDRRNQRLLATIIMAVAFLLFIFTLNGLSSLLDGTATATTFRYEPLSIVLVLIIYTLNRTGYYNIAATMLTLILIAVPIAANWNNPEGIARAAGFAAAAILLAGILLPRAYIFGISFIAIAAVSPALTTSTATYEGNITPVAMVILIAMLTLLFDNHRTALENERRAELMRVNEALRRSEEALQLANHGLEQKVAERTAELVVAKEEAERASTVKSAFLASMSHELRTPLNAIINFTRFVAKGAQGPINEEQEATLNEVVDSSRHLLSLINDVLDMSKIESGSLTLFIEDNVKLQPLLDTVISTGKSLKGDKPIEIQTEIADNLPTIRGDRQRILQILLNIMSNACKFTEEGTIKVCASQQADQVVFSVQDTGPGIAPEDAHFVFEAFKQTNTGLRQISGTGLGMPISRSLAEAHGGKLWLESEAGKGAKFTVSIPIKSQQLTPSLNA